MHILSDASLQQHQALSPLCIFSTVLATGVRSSALVSVMYCSLLSEATSFTWTAFFRRKKVTVGIKNCDTGVSLQKITNSNTENKMYPTTISYFWRFLNNTSAFRMIRDVAIQTVRGTFLPSSSLRSYVMTTCASRTFISRVAKNRPGLLCVGVK